AQTIASLYESARELESLVPQQIPPAMLRLLARFLEIEAASVYLLEGDRLVLAAAQGEAERALSLGADHPLYTVAVRHEPLAVTREEDHARAGVYLAAPLVHADGRPRGVVAIERLPFRQLTPATRQMLALLADWASRSLANSETYQEAQEQQRDHPVTRIRRVAYMNDRLAQEWSAARRYELPLSVVLVRHPGLDTAEGAAWEQGAVAVANVLKSRLRNVDVLGHHRSRGSFLLVLPVTPIEGARILTSRLAEALPDCLLAVGGNQEGHADAESLLQALQSVVFSSELKRAG
ncbi:MAG TPA: GAF domain-containing protein, partial [Oscillatoriaceae cyanobacterium]